MRRSRWITELTYILVGHELSIKAIFIIIQRNHNCSVWFVPLSDNRIHPNPHPSILRQSLTSPPLHPQIKTHCCREKEWVNKIKEERVWLAPLQPIDRHHYPLKQLPPQAIKWYLNRKPDHCGHQLAIAADWVTGAQSQTVHTCYLFGRHQNVYCKS